MSKLLEYYKILGVSAGAGIVDITTSYKRLCRIYHPDVNDDPESEELMKRINIAYSALREKYKRDTAIRDRAGVARTVRRGGEHRGYSSPSAAKRTYDAGRTKVMSEELDEKRASAVLETYFKAICACDYDAAYSTLSKQDKHYISQQSFSTWRKAVARLFPMRRFVIKKSAEATVSFRDGRTYNARRFHIDVTEKDKAEGIEETGEVEKLVVNENGIWRVFLGYKDVSEITKEFDERYESRQKDEMRRSWEEFCETRCTEYKMLSIKGLRKVASREIYRQSRYGGSLTFAIFSVKPVPRAPEGTHEDLLMCAAKSLRDQLRETDIAAYAGDGVFAVLLIELKKRHADAVTARIAEGIGSVTIDMPGGPVCVERAFESFSGYVGIESFNEVLEKFNKKI